MREQTSAIFKISSATLSAADMQARTGLKPDVSWKAGEARGAFGAVEKLHGFVLESAEPPQNSLDDHIKAMLKRLAPHAQHVGALVNEAKIELACIVHRKVAPALKFERDDLRWLGVMGAQLLVDVFIINDAAKDPAKKPAPGTPGAAGTPAPGGGSTSGF